MRFIRFLVPVAAVACSNSHQVLPDDSNADEEDLECPNIEHIPVTSPQTIGQPVEVSATVTDDSGVSSVLLYYKIETAIVWNDREPDPELSSGSVYTFVIPGTKVGGAGGMHYYIWAQDQSPKLNACTRPTDGEEGPYHFTIDDAEQKD